jgi:hypothetical protein
MLLLDIPVLFDATENEDRSNRHVPLIRASVGDQTTLLIVDTGSTETLLTRTLVEGLRIPLRPAEPGKDHAGGFVPTWTTAGSISVQMGSYSLLMENVSVVEIPSSLKSLGIGGVLCPQTLHNDATVLLDFRNDRIQLHPGTLDEAIGYNLVPELRSVAIERRRLVGEEAALVVVEGTLVPATPVSLMLNTGAYEAELAPGLTEHPIFNVEMRGRGLGGTPVQGSIAPGCEVELGGVRVALAEYMVRPQPNEIAGQLGMQALRGTRLALHARAESIRWCVPATWPFI